MKTQSELPQQILVLQDKEGAHPLESPIVIVGSTMQIPQLNPLRNGQGIWHWIEELAPHINADPDKITEIWISDSGARVNADLMGKAQFCFEDVILQGEEQNSEGAALLLSELTGIPVSPHQLADCARLHARRYALVHWTVCAQTHNNTLVNLRAH